MVVGEILEEVQLVVIGGGPGGYVAAFHAADHGVQTVLIDENPMLGGVCLREGCIPSKALLHVAHVIHDAEEAQSFGVTFKPPTIDAAKVFSWKQGVVDRLCGGISTLARKRNVRVIQGRAAFEDSKTIRIDAAGGLSRLKFKNAIIATGSRAKRLPEALIPRDCCVDAGGALDLKMVPGSLLVVGGGYIGLELGQVYASLGSKVTVIEVLDRILTGADDDLLRPLAARLARQFEAIHTGVKLESAKATGAGVEVSYSKGGEKLKQVFDRVLVSVGRQPNTDGIGLETTKVKVNERGFIEVNEQRQTTDKRIYAIGDVAGDPMLAHKASHEGLIAAQAIAGLKVAYDKKAIPAVVYTSPEVAWCGLTETEAKAKGLKIKVGKFPWGASGRAIAMGRPEGLTKVIADETNRRILGVGIVGEHAGDLISEAVLAMEMGAVPDDLALTVHPHPSISETLMEAAESVFGKSVHVAR